MYNNKFVTQIVAVNNKSVIGKDNKLLWHNKEDLEHFKKTTMWNTLIVGNKTYKSLPSAVHKGRILYPVSRTGMSLETALEKASQECNNDNIYIIGGGEIYKETFQYTDYIKLSKINDDQDGDTFFSVPDDFELEYKIDNPTFTLEVYKRKSAVAFIDSPFSGTCGILTGSFELTTEEK